MLTYQRRSILVIVFAVILLAMFAGVALFGPEDPCANVVDFCDDALRST